MENLNILACESYSSATSRSYERWNRPDPRDFCWLLNVNEPVLSTTRWLRILRHYFGHLWCMFPIEEGHSGAWFTLLLSCVRRKEPLSIFVKKEKKESSLLERNYFNHWRVTPFIQVKHGVKTITPYYWQIPSQPEMQQNKHRRPQPQGDHLSEQAMGLLFTLFAQIPSKPNTHRHCHCTLPQICRSIYSI